jgi:hypothetical protein
LCRHAGDRRNPLNRILRRSVCKDLQGGTASDLPLQRVHRAARKQVSVSPRPCSGLAVVGDQVAVPLPGGQHDRVIASGLHVTVAQQGTGVFAHQQGRIGPLAHEAGIKAARLQKQVGDAQRQRLIRARPDLQPAIGAACIKRRARVNHHKLRAAPHGLLNLDGPRQPGRSRIVTPQQDAIGTRKIWRADITAIGEPAGDILVPVADLGAINGIRASECPHQAFDPGNGIRDMRAAGCRDRKRHLLSPVLIANAAHVAGDFVKRLMP